VDGVTEPGDGQFGQLLGDALEAVADVVELAGHRCSRAWGSEEAERSVTERAGRRPAGASVGGREARRYAGAAMAHAPSPPRQVHEWVSLEVDGETYQFDLTFLTSNWRCLYGDGCPGIDEAPAPELE